MSNERAASTEEKVARLQSAREELDELLTEQRNLPRELEGARREDHEERMQAASSGGRIRAAVSSMVSRVRDVEDRREALRHEIWSASIRVNELEADHSLFWVPRTSRAASFRFSIASSKTGPSSFTRRVYASSAGFPPDINSQVS